MFLLLLLFLLKINAFKETLCIWINLIKFTCLGGSVCFHGIIAKREREREDNKDIDNKKESERVCEWLRKDKQYISSTVGGKVFVWESVANFNLINAIWKWILS